MAKKQAAKKAAKTKKPKVALSDKAMSEVKAVGDAMTPEQRSEVLHGPNKGGRPSTYSVELAATICARLVEGESLRSICRDESMPGLSTVFQWLAADKAFAELYVRAREEQAETLAAEIVEIADEEKYEPIEVEGVVVGVRFDSTAVSRNKLRVDTRKWVASKLKPRVYGDKVQLADAEGNKLPPAPQFILAPVAPGPIKDADD